MKALLAVVQTSNVQSPVRLAFWGPEHGETTRGGIPWDRLILCVRVSAVKGHSSVNLVGTHIPLHPARDLGIPLGGLLGAAVVGAHLRS